MPNFPYPTYIEIIRALARSFGVKNSNKQLDDKAFDKYADACLVSEFETEIVKPISTYVDDKLANRVSSYIQKFFDDYTAIIANLYADGITRNEMVVILSNSIFAEHILKFYAEELTLISGPSPILFFSSGNGSVPEVLKWLEDNEPSWKKYIRTMDKQNRDKIKSWQTQEHIPSIQSIVLLQTWFNGTLAEQINWKKVRVLLWIASAMDRGERDYDTANLKDSCRLILWGAQNHLNISKMVSNAQSNFKQNISEVLPLVSEVQQGLRRAVPKIANAQAYFRETLDNMRAALGGSPDRGSGDIPS
jgi:hypothetical protein